MYTVTPAFATCTCTLFQDIQCTLYMYTTLTVTVYCFHFVVNLCLDVVCFKEHFKASLNSGIYIIVCVCVCSVSVYCVTQGYLRMFQRAFVNLLADNNGISLYTSMSACTCIIESYTLEIKLKKYFPNSLLL